MSPPIYPVRVRRSNGQCEYGPWLAYDHESVPEWVHLLIDEQIIEEDREEGIVQQGGSVWAWRAG